MKAKPARLDADRTARALPVDKRSLPLSEIVHHNGQSPPSAGCCVGPGSKLQNPEYRSEETGSISLKASFAPLHLHTVYSDDEVFLGSFENLDLWFRTDAGYRYNFSFVIARYGSDPNEYNIYPIIPDFPELLPSHHQNWYKLALELAKKAGILT